MQNFPLILWQLKSIIPMFLFCPVCLSKQWFRNNDKMGLLN